MFRRLLIQTTLLMTTIGAAHAAPHLELGPAAGIGDTVTVPIVFSHDREATVAALAGEIRYDDAALENPAAVEGTAALAAGKMVSATVPESGVLRLGVLGYNRTDLDSGVVAVVTFKRKPGKATSPLAFKFAFSGASPAGDEVPVDPAEGKVTLK